MDENLLKAVKRNRLLVVRGVEKYLSNIYFYIMVVSSSTLQVVFPMNIKLARLEEALSISVTLQSAAQVRCVNVMPKYKKKQDKEQQLCSDTRR